MTDTVQLKEYLTGESNHEIPIDHLDFSYIDKCSNVKELEKIFRILKSGKEGKFPELEAHCEKKLQTIHPESRALRKETRLLTPGEIDPCEWKQIDSELKDWISSSKAGPSNGRASTVDKLSNLSCFDNDDNLPPIRSMKTISAGNKVPQKSSCLKTKRPMPRDYNEWSKLEKQLENDSGDDESENKKNEIPDKKSVKFGASAGKLNTSIDTSNLSFIEKSTIAEREKQKGNEAFRAGDLEEALTYYTRSIDVQPLATCYNNRALIYIKMKKWFEAVKDCSKVLKMEPKNVKALMRRATAYSEQHRLSEASADLMKLLKLEPDHKQAQTLLDKVCDDQKKRDESKLSGGKRIVIEEEESSDDEESPPAVDNKSPANIEGNMFKSSEQSRGHEAAKDNASHGHNNTDTSSKEGGDIWTSDEAPVVTNMDSLTADITTRKTCWEQTNAQSDSSSSEPVLTDEEKYNQWKEKGNELFKKKEYVPAMQYYDQCIDLCPDEIAAYRNRALCNIHLDKPNDAIYDCNMALDLDQMCHVSLYRRGLARKLLGDYKAAFDDLTNALSIKSDSTAIKKEIETVKCLMTQQTSSRKNQRLIYEVEDSEKEKNSERPSVRITEWNNCEDGDTIRDNDMLPHEKEQRKSNKNGEDYDKTSTNQSTEPPVSTNQSTEPPVSTNQSTEPPVSTNQSTEPPVSTNQSTEPSVSTNQSTEPPVSTNQSTEPPVSTNQSQEPPVSINQSQEPNESVYRKKIRPDGKFILPNEFRNRYTALRPTFRAEKVGELLMQVDSSKFSKYISNQLDDVMLSAIVTSLKNYFLPNNFVKESFDLLSNLIFAERFSIVTALMPSSCRRDLTVVLSRLEAEISAGRLIDLSVDDVTKLKKSYCLP